MVSHYLKNKESVSFAFSIGIGYLLSIRFNHNRFCFLIRLCIFQEGLKRNSKVPVNRSFFHIFLFSFFDIGGTLAPSIISRSQCLEIDFVYSSNSLTMFLLFFKKSIKSAFLSSKIQTLGSKCNRIFYLSINIK